MTGTFVQQCSQNCTVGTHVRTSKAERNPGKATTWPTVKGRQCKHTENIRVRVKSNEMSHIQLRKTRQRRPSTEQRRTKQKNG